MRRTIRLAPSCEHSNVLKPTPLRRHRGPSDDVEVTAVVVARWRPLYPGWRCDAELVLRACHMRVEERGARPGSMQGVEMGDLFRCA